MELTPTPIPGCYLVQCDSSRDRRGLFVKTFHEQKFRELGLSTDWPEEYYTVSGKNVIRGMHFQVPPDAHDKLVYCLDGEVLDVVLDLRVGSPQYGQCHSVALTPDNLLSLYIPAGVAHGFLALKDRSLLQYKVTSVYSPEHDAGILWDSVPFDWAVKDPVLSDRDRKHPPLQDFHSPFVFEVMGS